MPELNQVPEWLGVALVSAIIAALGYVAKQVLDWITSVRAVKNARQAALVELQSLLRASWVSFVIQNAHAQRLLEMIEEHHPGPLPSGEGYERVFVVAFPSFTPDEQERHAIIRSLTIYSLRPVNERLSEWLRQDVYFKAQSRRSGTPGELARKLADLEAHLLLWNAKYETWIPDHPEHALVYLADEQKHGLGFPKGIDEIVAQVLEKQ